MDASGRVYGIDHCGDWFLGSSMDQALCTLVLGDQPSRLTASPA